MNPEEIRKKVHVSAQNFADNFVVIQAPKVVAALWVPHLNDIGLDLQIMDDGEDDGVPVVLVIPRSTALDEPIRQSRRLLILKSVLFLLFSLGVVLLSATHVHAAYIVTCMAVMVFVGVHTAGESVLLGRRRKLRDYLRDHGM